MQQNTSEIVESVCDEGLRPLLEDTMADEEILAMIRKCWSEDVIDRPDFVSLQSIMRKVNKYVMNRNTTRELTSLFCFPYIYFLFYLLSENAVKLSK